MKIIARNNFVVVRSVETEKTDIGDGLLTRSTQGDRGVRPCTGVVESVGPDVSDKTQVGQVIAFDQYHSGTIEFRGEKRYAVKEDMIVGEITDAD